MRMLQGVKPWAFFAPGMACSVVALSTVAAGDPHASDPLVWAAWTASPTLITEPTGARDAELLAHCGAGEAGLREAAKRVVRERITEGAHLDVDRLEMTLRASGEPHVWPRAWVVSGRALDRDATLAKLDAWRASFRDDGERRCGIASATTSDGTEFIAAVALDALADLAPLPLRTHIGTWLTVDAKMLASARGAHVVIQGPEADSHRVPSWTREENGETHVIARFAPDRAGAFTVQLVADVSTGPRPILEARVFADVDPPDHVEAPIAPGEEAARSVRTASESDALLLMVASLRESERLVPLVRDARLDALALSHARHMLAARTVGHDVGDGDPQERLEDSGARARVVGENVAHAASIRLAHRALYASPSHRANLLRDDFTRVGVAAVDDADGSVWVVELFAAGLR